MTINISLNQTLQEFIREQMEQYGYNTASEYMRDLLRSAKRRAAHNHLDQLLIEGLESGTSTPMTTQDWGDVHTSVQNKILRKSTT